MSHNPGETAISIIFQPAMLLMAGAMFYMLFLVIRAATARNPQSVNGLTPDGGRMIPVKATFSGVRGLSSRIAVASNSASPLFIVGQYGIEYRVMKTHKRAFRDIEQIDVRTAWRTVNLEFQFRGDILTLAVNIGTPRSGANRASTLSCRYADVPTGKVNHDGVGIAAQACGA